MPDEPQQIGEPQQGPVRQLPSTQQRQQQNKPQQQPQRQKHVPRQELSVEEIADALEAIRRSVGVLEGCETTQDKVVTELSRMVTEAMEAQGTRQKAVLADLEALRKDVTAALETTQQMHRAMIATLNQRQNPRTWPASKVAILVFAVAVVFSVALVWHG